jgi:3-methylcrotonyl-CoA carboxylase alpha subunit
MNTRLQVEHPVTELVAGVDLVEWQLRVAAGEPLPCGQDDLGLDGHAFEARLYAEDPMRDFLPMTGRLVHLRAPPEGPHVRIDTGVREGDAVTIHYDPMIAKLVVWDADRPAALRRLRAALAAYEIVGLPTNLAFLADVAAHPAFAEGLVDTGFIERHKADLLPAAGAAPDTVLGLACLSLFLDRAAAAAAAARRSADPWSPWHRTDGWRLNDDNQHRLTLVDGEREVPVTVHYRRAGYLIELPGGALAARGELAAAGGLVADLDGARYNATVVRRDHELTVLFRGRPYRLMLHDPLTAAVAAEAPSGALNAPMPGKVTAVMVEPGQAVDKGAALMVLEAMKMEQTITAPMAGVVARVHYAAGDQVEEGAELLSIEAARGA